MLFETSDVVFYLQVYSTLLFFLNELGIWLAVKVRIKLCHGFILFCQNRKDDWSMHVYLYNVVYLYDVQWCPSQGRRKWSLPQTKRRVFDPGFFHLWNLKVVNQKSKKPISPKVIFFFFFFIIPNMSCMSSSFSFILESYLWLHIFMAYVFLV